VLEARIAAWPFADDGVKARVRMVFAALQAAQAQRLAQWQSEAEAAGDGAGAPDGSGGWPAEEHRMFVTLRQKCARDAGRGAVIGGGGGGSGSAREALMRVLAVMMPARSVQQLMAHDDWLTAHKLLQVCAQKV
jgi:hypothetical protein